jgi:hypothetical protein
MGSGGQNVRSGDRGFDWFPLRCSCRIPLAGSYFPRAPCKASGRARNAARSNIRAARFFPPPPLDLKRGPIGQVTRTPAILFFARPAARPRRRSSDFSFDSAANRKKIAVGKLERIAAGDHRVAILEFDEAGIHRAAHDDKTELAFPALPVPAIDVRLLTHDTPRFRAPQIFSIHATAMSSQRMALQTRFSE